MNKSVFFLTLFLLCLSPTYLLMSTQSPTEQSMHDMVILLNKDEKGENIGKPNYSLASKLQTALAEQTCPIVVSTSLFATFLEKRKSIEQMSQFPGTPEHTLSCHYQKIIKRLNELYTTFIEKGLSPFQAKYLMIESVNRELFIGKKPEYSASTVHALLSSLTLFNSNCWEMYACGSLLLLIPKSYIQSLANKKSISDTALNDIKTKAQLLGLRVDQLQKVTDTQDIGKLVLEAHSSKSNSFVDQLHHIFITNDTTSSFHTWNICLAGHGGPFYEETLDKNNRVSVQANAQIADLKPDEFIQFLSFLQEKIKTNCLHFATCYGGGMHLKMLFEDRNNPSYNYTIIAGCLSDSISTVRTSCALFAAKNSENSITPGDLLSTQDNQWTLAINQGLYWKKFFKQLHKNSFSNSHLLWLYPAIYAITRTDRVFNTPLIRLAGTDKFMPLLYDEYMLINNPLIQLKAEQQLPLKASKEIHTILVESSVIPPLTIENKNHAMPRIVSLQPGNAQHYFEKITCQNGNDFVSAFWPLDEDLYDRTFVIDELIFPIDPNNPFEKALVEKTLGITKQQVCSKNVLIVTHQADVVRIYFQTEENKSFLMTLVINQVNTWKKQVIPKAVHELSPEATAQYLSIVQETKAACLEKTIRT